MRDRFSKAVEELSEKSPFVCVSCGHPDTIAKADRKNASTPGVSLHDRFSEAVREEEEKSAFVCESCREKFAGRSSTRH